MRRRRIAIAFASVAVLTVSCCALAPGLLMRAAAPHLSAHLGTRVRLGWLWWNPLVGEWTLEGAEIAARQGPPALAVRRLTARILLWDVLRGRHRVRALMLDGARVRLRATASGWGLPLAGDGVGSGSSPALMIDWAAAPRAVVRLEARNGTRSLLRLRQLEASGTSDPAGVRAAVWTRGRLDRSSIAFAGRLRTAAGGHRVRLRLAASGLDLGRTVRLAAGAAVGDLRGRLDLHAKYDEAGENLRVQRRIGGSVSGRDVALRAHGVDGIWVRGIEVPRFTVDLGARSVALGAVRLRAPEVWVRREGALLAVPGLLGEEPAGDASSTAGWTITAASVGIAGGAVHGLDVGAGGESLDFVVKDASTGAIGSVETPTPFSLVASVSSGGHLKADGDLVRQPLRGRTHLQVDDLALPPLATLLNAPLRLESGRAGATLDVMLGGGGVEAAGTLVLTDVKTFSPDPSRPEDVVALKEARLAIRRVQRDPPLAAFDSIEVSWPYVLVDRGATGIFPFSLASGSSSSLAPGVEPSVAVRADRLRVEGGRIDFRDTTLSPPYWRALANLKVEARGVEAPNVRVRNLHASGLVDELSPLRVDGIVGTRSRLVAQVERLALPPFNAYLEAAAPYHFLSGVLSGRSEVVLDRSQLEVNNRVVLSRFGLAGGGDQDFVQRELGIPLTLALALMKDYRGNIELALPFGGDLRSPTLEMRSVMFQAIVRAVRGAVLSPLNALGRVVLRDGRIEHIELDPIPFRPGARDLDAAGRERVTQIARVLASRVDLAVRMRGRVADADLQRLQDEAALSALVEAPAAEPLRTFLRARLAGLPVPPLDDDQRRQLEALLGTLAWPGQALHDLAVDRAAVAAAALILDHHLDPERVSTDLPDVPEASRLAALPSVAVELQER